MQYAIIQSGGKQYKVEPGQEIEVELLSPSVIRDNKVSFTDVLLVRTPEHVHVGAPTVPESTVEAQVLATTKGEKIRVARFKAKVNYRKVTGFRPKYTKVLIESITVNGKKSVAEKKELPKKTETPTIEAKQEKPAEKPAKKRSVKTELTAKKK